MAYFSERQQGTLPRTSEAITPEAWAGIWAIITTRLQNGSFANLFPEQCPDGYGVVGHDPALFEAAIRGDGLTWPVEKDNAPDTLAVLDLLEFCHANVAKPQV